MGRFTLSFDEESSEEVKLQVEFGPPPKFFDDYFEAMDWAWMNLPRGVHIEIRDGRKFLRAEGLTGTALKEYTPKRRKKKCNPQNIKSSPSLLNQKTSMQSRNE